MSSDQQPVKHRASQPNRNRRKTRRIAAATVLLTVAGIALIAAGCAASRPGPPQPSAAAAGTIPPAATPDSMSSSTPLSSTSASSPTRTTAEDSNAAGGTTNPADSVGAPAASTHPKPTRAPATSAAPRSHAPATSHPARIVHDTDPGITGPAVPHSRPVRLAIPAIGVNTTLLTLGLNPDGTVQVPPLDDPDSKAGWYKNSPTPGAAGPAVILGHIDSAKYGPGVFYHLGHLRPGDHADVTLADGTVAVFRIDAVRSYPKDDFPTLEVYGNIDYAGLRLITCGGAFDYSARSYENNIVAYASLVSSHHA